MTRGNKEGIYDQALGVPPDITREAVTVSLGQQIKVMPRNVFDPGTAIPSVLKRRRVFFKLSVASRIPMRPRQSQNFMFTHSSLIHACFYYSCPLLPAFVGCACRFSFGGRRGTEMNTDFSAADV